MMEERNTMRYSKEWKQEEAAVIICQSDLRRIVLRSCKSIKSLIRLFFCRRWMLCAAVRNNLVMYMSVAFF